jgi:hypothetical protein
MNHKTQWYCRLQLQGHQDELCDNQCERCVEVATYLGSELGLDAFVCGNKLSGNQDIICPQQCPPCKEMVKIILNSSDDQKEKQNIGKNIE